MRAAVVGCVLAGWLLLWGCGDASVEIPPSLKLTSAAPHHGATQVSTSTSVELVFDAPLAEDTLSAASVRLEQAATGLPCERLLSSDRRGLTLVPERVLEADTEYEIVVEHSLSGQDTAQLGTTLRSRFRTGR